jgi:predicted transcriptional regulator
MKRSIDDLGELQRAVMDVLWRRWEAGGGATVQEVREALGGEKALAYTTVLSVMQKLEKQGWLRHREAGEAGAGGRAYVYEPTRSREEAGARTVRSFLDRVFGGDRLALFQHLLDERPLSPKEVDQLRRMIAAGGGRRQVGREGRRREKTRKGGRS